MFIHCQSLPRGGTSQVAPVVKNPPADAGDIRDVSSVPGMGRSPGGGHGNPLQCSCLENPMDRGAWRATVQGVAKSQTPLSTANSEYCFSWYSVVQLLSRVQLFASPWTIARQAPLSMGFSRQEDWSGLPCPPPGDLPEPGVKPASLNPPVLQADSLPSEAPGKP